MRDLLRLPALFLFFLVLLLLLVAGVDLLATWGEGLSAGREEALALTGARLLPALRDALPVSVLLALVLLLFSTSLRPGSRFLSLLVPLTVSFVLLAFGYQALEGLESRLESGRAEAMIEAPSPERYLVEERFTRTGEQVLYLSELEDAALRGIVLFDSQAGPRKLRYFPSGQVQVAGAGVRMRLGGATQELTLEPVYAGLFRPEGEVRPEALARPGPVIGPLLQDIRLLNGVLARLFQESRPAFLLLCFALVFAFHTAGLLLRLSRWPLLNVVIALLVLRGYLYLVRLLGHDMTEQLGKVFPNPGAVRCVPALILLVLGVLFLLIEVLFIPRGRRRREHA